MRRAGLLLLAVLLLGASAGPPRYDRAAWMPRGWEDADGDCQDTRTEVLIRDARPGTVQLDARGCRVVAGTWLDPYTGRVFTDPGLLDVDHLVPLFRAHLDGGWRWSEEKRRDFSNDLTYRWALVPVESRVNRGKGTQGPEMWRPPRREFWCQYAQAWATIKAKWRLQVRQDEADSLAQMLLAC